MHVGTVGREPTTAASLARMRAVEGSTCAAGPRIGIAWTGMPKGSRQNIRAATVSRELSGPGWMLIVNMGADLGCPCGLAHL